MKKRKLNYRFHDPNTAETAANYLLKVLITHQKWNRPSSKAPTDRLRKNSESTLCEAHRVLFLVYIYTFCDIIKM